MVVIKKYDDGFLVRTAEAKDKEAVVGIDAFKGLDYIVTIYDHVVENPDFHGFVGEIDEQVIAFAFVCIMDEGQTALRGGFRLHQDFRGRGYFSKFIHPAEDYVTTQCLDVKQWRYATLSDDFQKQHIPKLKNAGALQVLIKRDLTLIITTIASLKSLQSEEFVEELFKEYDVEDVEIADQVPSCLLDPSSQAALFPDEIVTAYLFPHKCIQSGFESIVHMPWFMQCNITSSDSNVNTTSSDTKVNTTSSDTKLKAVSFISGGPSGENSMMADVDLYISKDLSEDEQEKCWKQHAIVALTRDWSKYEDEMQITLVFFTSGVMDSEKVGVWILENFPDTSQLFPGTSDHFIVEYDQAKWKQNQLAKKTS